MSHQQYQTVREVAELLKVSEVTVRRWIKDGELRAINIGKGWRIGANDLETFLEGHETRPSEKTTSPGDTEPSETSEDKTKAEKT